MRRFGSIAITRLTQAAIGVATMLGLGWAAVAPFGLLFGSMLSASAGSVRLGRDALRAERTFERVGCDDDDGHAA